MDQSIMDLPQFAQMRKQELNPELETPFNVSINSFEPKVLSYSFTQKGNIILYESNKNVLLLVTPPGVNLDDLRKSTEAYPIPGGLTEIGYVFYKNKPEMIEKLDKIVGVKWKSNLSEPLPVVDVKTPILMVRTNITYSGHVFPASLWEYSDKTLAVFANLDFSGGDNRKMKPFGYLTNPDLGNKKTPGFMIYKSVPDMVDFAKKHFGDNIESMYTKSVAPIRVIQEDPILIETKSFIYGDINASMELYEYSILALSIFCFPQIELQGFELTNNLNHPTKGKIPGYIVPKASTDKIGIVKGFFGLQNLEESYMLTAEKSSRSTGVFAPISSESSVANVIGKQSGMSDFGIKALEDIPMTTLIRLLMNKIKGTEELQTKKEPTGNILVYGKNDDVLDQLGYYEDVKVLVKIEIDDKSAYFIDSNF